MDCENAPDSPETIANAIQYFRSRASPVTVVDKTLTPTAALNMQQIASLSVPKSPGRLFVLILSLTFVVEAVIMMVLPVVVGGMRPSLLWSLADAGILTAVIAPAIWVSVVKPLRKLSLAREHMIHALFDAQEQERARIARDLHDEIGQQLTAMQVGLSTIAVAPDLQTAQQLAHDLREVGAMAHDELRRLASGLQPGVLEELGLPVAVERLCEDFERAHGIEVHVKVPPEAAESLALPVTTALYRILQESLTNVAKHAAATTVDVSLNRTRNTLVLAISDDGRGMPTRVLHGECADAGGMGLDSIRERVQMLHGECTIGRSDSGGVLVKVVIPTSS